VSNSAGALVWAASGSADSAPAQKEKSRLYKRPSLICLRSWFQSGRAERDRELSSSGLASRDDLRQPCLHPSSVCNSSKRYPSAKVRRRACCHRPGPHKSVLEGHIYGRYVEMQNTGESDLNAGVVASIEHARADRPGDGRGASVGSAGGGSAGSEVIWTHGVV